MKMKMEAKVTYKMKISKFKINLFYLLNNNNNSNRLILFKMYLYRDRMNLRKKRMKMRKKKNNLLKYHLRGNQVYNNKYN